MSYGLELAEALATEIVSGGGTARAFGCDMADPGAPERLIDDVEVVADLVAADKEKGLDAQCLLRGRRVEHLP